MRLILVLLLGLLCVGCYEEPTQQPLTPPTPVQQERSFGVDGFTVLILEEVSERDNPENQDFLEVLTSTKLRTLLTTKCEAWHIWDKDSDYSLDQHAEYWAHIRTEKPTAYPWVYIAKGSEVLYSGLLPSGEQETINLVKKYTGE